MEIVKFYTCPGQVKSHNELVQRKFYLSKRIDYCSLYLTMLKQYMNYLENSMKPDVNSIIVNSVNPDQLAFSEAS